MRVARLMVLACLAALAGAAENHAAIAAPVLATPAAARAKAATALVAPTRIRLDGHVRLGDAIASLCRSGNPTALAKALDASRSADIAQDGDTYWSAVAAVCKAFALKPAPGALCAARVARDDLVAVEAGPLLLADAGDERGMLLPCGPAAMTVKECHIERARGDHTEIHLGLTAGLRLEPRVSADAVGWCGLRITQVADQRGRMLPLQGERERDYSEVARDLDLQLTPSEEPTELGIVGELHLALAVPWHITTAIAAGAATAIACGDQTLSLLLIDAEHTAPAGTQGPLVELDYPHAAILGEPRLSLARAGADVGARGGGSFDTANGRSIILALQKVDADPYQATIAGATPLGDPVTMPMRLRVPLAELSDSAALTAPTAYFAPSQVRWDAARLSLRDAIATLGRTGGPVLLQLGTDERQERDLPAFSGTFWDGLLTLCRAYSLQPALESVGSGAASAGGEDGASEGMVTVGLGPVSVGAADGPLGATASGPLLVENAELTMVEARSLAGGGRHLNVALRLRLEPRVPDEAIGYCSATVDTFCRDDAGNVLTAVDPRLPAPYAGTFQRAGRHALEPRRPGARRRDRRGHRLPRAHRRPAAQHPHGDHRRPPAHRHAAPRPPRGVAHRRRPQHPRHRRRADQRHAHGPGRGRERRAARSGDRRGGHAQPAPGKPQAGGALGRRAQLQRRRGGAAQPLAAHLPLRVGRGRAAHPGDRRRAARGRRAPRLHPCHRGAERPLRLRAPIHR